MGDADDEPRRSEPRDLGHRLCHHRRHDRGEQSDPVRCAGSRADRADGTRALLFEPYIAVGRKRCLGRHVFRQAGSDDGGCGGEGGRPQGPRHRGGCLQGTGVRTEIVFNTLSALPGISPTRGEKGWKHAHLPMFDAEGAALKSLPLVGRDLGRGLRPDPQCSYCVNDGSARSVKRVNSDWKASFTVPVGP